MNTYYTILISKEDNPIVAEIIPHDKEQDILRDVYNITHAKYKLKHFVVRRLYDYFTQENMQEMKFTHCVSYYYYDYDADRFDETVFVDYVLKPISKENLSFADFCEIKNGIIKNVKISRSVDDGRDFDIEPFICFKTLEGAMNHFAKEHGLPYTQYSDNGKINSYTICGVEIPSKCSIC